MAILESFTTEANARRLLRLNEVQVARMLCGKCPLGEYTFGSQASEKSIDKRLDSVFDNWLKYITKHIPDSNLYLTYGKATGEGTQEETSEQNRLTN